MKEHGDSFIFWNFIGAANLNLGMFEEASEAFYKVITLNPKLPSGYNNYGYTFLKLGKLEKAIENFYKAISISNEYEEAYINLGIAYKEKGENEVAIQNYKKLLSFRPNNEKAYNNLGVIYREEKMFDKASKAFLTAITLKSNYYEAFLNLGILYLSQGEFTKAIDYLKKTLSINPSSYEAFNNLGGAYYQKGEFNKAINFYNKALTINPNLYQPYDNIGNIYKENGSPNKAIKFFNEALNLKPDSEDIFAKKIHQHAIICDWDPIKNNHSLFHKVGTTDQSISPFSLLSIEDAPERHKKRSQIFRKHNFPNVPLWLEKKSKKNKEIIHIGYFSSDFREHPVAYLLVGVLQKHNRKNFKIYGYSIDKASEDEFSKKIINLFDVFHNVKNMSNKEITMLARSDEIDIAIDLNGYTQYSRTEIFAYRAAPIQINFLGYPGTLGAEFIDYIVADKNLIPKKSQKFYSEKNQFICQIPICQQITKGKFQINLLQKVKWVCPKIVLFFVVLIIISR